MLPNKDLEEMAEFLIRLLHCQIRQGQHNNALILQVLVGVLHRNDFGTS
jgi:hypothetical protein